MNGAHESHAASPVIVIGGMNMDVLGTPHAPLLVRDSNPGTVTLRPGGVGRNIAWGIARLNIPVELITAVGNDAFGKALLESCRADGIGTSYTAITTQASGTYLCLNDADGDMLYAINQMEAVETLSPQQLAPLVSVCNNAPLVVLDANLPEATLSFLAEAVTAPLFVDPVSAHKAERIIPILPRLYAIKPNRLEAEILTGIDCSTPDGVRRAAEYFLARGVRRVYISLGRDGAYYMDAQDRGTVPSLVDFLTPIRDTTGAGDAMTAGLIWAELRGYPIMRCALSGMRAAGARMVSGTLDVKQFLTLFDPHEHLRQKENNP